MARDGSLKFKASRVWSALAAGAVCGSLLTPVTFMFSTLTSDLLPYFLAIWALAFIPWFIGMAVVGAPIWRVFRWLRWESGAAAAALGFVLSPLPILAFYSALGASQSVLNFEWVLVPFAVRLILSTALSGAVAGFAVWRMAYGQVLDDEAVDVF